MKNMKKKLLIAVAVMVCVLAFVGCGQKQEAEDTTAAAGEEMPLVINNQPFCVSPQDCDEQGYACLACDETNTYSFKAVNKGSDKIKWDVYVLDKKFDDETKYLNKSEEPKLSGDGELKVKKGQYIYVYSSVNGFTNDGKDLPKDSYLEINYAE